MSDTKPCTREELATIEEWASVKPAHDDVGIEVVRLTEGTFVRLLATAKQGAEVLQLDRETFHGTYNGGWHGNDDGMRAFHHGMDTVFNAIDAVRSEPAAVEREARKTPVPSRAEKRAAFVRGVMAAGGESWSLDEAEKASEIAYPATRSGSDG